MSLKAFHLVFIALAALLACGVGARGIARFIESGSAAQLASAVASFLFAVGLAAYGAWFISKWRRLP